MSEQSIVMQYAGAIGLLCELSTQIGVGPEADEYRACIESAASDWCSTSGWGVRRTLNRIEVVPPKAKGEPHE